MTRLRAGLSAALLALTSALPAAEAETRAGDILSGAVRLDGKILAVETASGRKDIPLSDLFEIRFSAPSSVAEDDGAGVTLRDGSRLVGAVGASATFDAVELTRGADTVLRIPTDRLSRIEFAPLAPGVSAATAPAGAGPYVVMRNGRVIAAAIEWLTFLEAGLKTDAGRIRVRRTEIHRLDLAPADQPPAGAAFLRTLSGDMIHGTLTTLEPDRAALASLVGPLDFRPRGLYSIEMNTDRVVLLTSRPCAAAETTPFFDFVRPYVQNASLFGGLLRVRGFPFDNGLAVHSRTALHYKIDGAFQRFVVVAGLDTRITDRGRAIFRIVGDGKTLAESTQTGTSDPARLSVPVKRTQTLDLLFDYGEGGSVGDHGVWANPRLLR